MRADLGTTDDLRELTSALRASGHLAVPRPRAQPRRPRARVGPAGAGGGGALPRLLPRVPRPRAARRLRADAARGVPRLRRRQLQPRRRAATAGCGPPSTPGSGTSNWSNPDVLAEMADVVLYLANLGVEVLRLDAIAFIWKRLGTNCQNQPEVHGITQALQGGDPHRRPAMLLKAEAIVGPADLVAYLGQGRHAGRVSDLAYHNGLMVQVLVGARLARHRADGRGARRGAAGAEHDGVDHLRALPRRHRLGRRRRRRRRGRALRRRPPRLPVRLLLRRAPGLVRRGPGVPGQPGDRRPPHQRLGREPQPASRGRPGDGDEAATPTPSRRCCSAHARGAGLGRRAGAVVGRRDRRAQRRALGRRAGPRRRQPLGAPAPARRRGARRRREADPSSPGGRALAGLRAPRPRARRTAAPARVGRVRGRRDARPRRARRAAPAPAGT